MNLKEIIFYGLCFFGLLLIFFPLFWIQFYFSEEGPISSSNVISNSEMKKNNYSTFQIQGLSDWRNYKVKKKKKFQLFS